MKRHNAQQKMDLRLKDQEHKNEKLAGKGERERAEMEAKSEGLPFWVFCPCIFKPPKLKESFTVFLKVPLTEAEIRERMMKGFGDI